MRDGRRCSSAVVRAASRSHRSQQHVIERTILTGLQRLAPSKLGELAALATPSQRRPLVRPLAVKRHEIEPGNGITIAIHSDSFRSVRGLAGSSSARSRRARSA